MSTLIVIPARYGSTRFPGKPMAPIRGITGKAKPLVQRVWESARACTKAVDVIIATDDEGIARAAEAFGANVFTTSPDHQNGTERCSEAADLWELQNGKTVTHVVNLQGDAPLVPASVLDDFITTLEMDTDPDAVLTVAVRQAGLGRHRWGKRHTGLPVRIERSRDGRALWFSRTGLPVQIERASDGRALWFSRTDALHETVFEWAHLGLYGIPRDLLVLYDAEGAAPAEEAASLEQLRWLDLGVDVHLFDTSVEETPLAEVNTPDDVSVIEYYLRWRETI